MELDLVAALVGVLPPELALGSRRSEIEAVLGSATDHAMPSAAILLYGTIEFHFHGEKGDRDPKLWLIFSDHPAYEGTDRLRVRGGWICPGLARERALTHLATAGLTPEEPARFAGLDRLDVGPRMRLHFEPNEVDDALVLGGFAIMERR